LAEAAQITERHKPHISVEEVLALSGSLGEPSALTSLRRRGLAYYTTMEIPDRVQHLWRYTDPLVLLPSEIHLDQHLRKLLPQQLEAPPSGASVLLSQGLPIGITCTEAAAAAGVEIRPLQQAGEALGVVGRAVRPSHGLFEALNTAAWTSGVWIGVPPGVRLGGELEIVVEVFGSSTTMPRVLMTVGEDAEVTLIERHQGGSLGDHVVGVSELFAGPGANVRHLLVQDWSPKLSGYMTSRAIVERDASLLTVLTSFGGGKTKLDIGADLVGEGARSELVGVVLGDGRQHLDHHTVHRHYASRTWSNIDLKTALFGRSRSAYTGLIRIEERASDCEAYQEERNLLLGRGCRADAIPELEILNNEVQCSHGATTSPLDDEHLFYLRSRGIPELEARGLVVRGFFESILRRVPQELRGLIESRLESRLSRSGGR